MKARRLLSPLPFPNTPEFRDQLAAIRATARGEANPDQQKAAMRAVTEHVCGFHDLSFVTDDLGGERVTAFREGRRAAGATLQRIITAPNLADIVEEKT